MRPCAASSGATMFMPCITSWDSFEPWLSGSKSFPESSLWPLADQIPPEWYGGATEIERLLERLLERRSRVRELILDFKNSSRNPFPNWREGASGHRCDPTSLRRTMIVRYPVTDDTAGNLIHSFHN